MTGKGTCRSCAELCAAFPLNEDEEKLAVHCRLSLVMMTLLLLLPLMMMMMMSVGGELGKLY